MRCFVVFAYLLAAAVNLAPAIGVLSDGLLIQLYSIQIQSAEISLLLRHRAVLFALVGGLLLAATFIERLRTQAGIAGIVCMLSFILLFVFAGTENANLLRVAQIDSIVVLVFSAGFALHLSARESQLK